MREYSIETIDYRIDIADRIRRALRGAEGVGVRGEGQRAAVITRDEEAREQLCMALCRVLLNDAAAEEIKRELKVYPLEAAEAERAAVRAAELMRRVPRRASLFANALTRLMEYTKAESALNIEGFLRFRLADAANLIRLCALRAAMEELIRRELSAGTDGETIIIITRDTDPSTEPD
ncbi:MAG: hypothetical protein SOY77_00790 [Eubacteriales bacterium]|nr:hypothetical protein [Eubacteriales bacterium]